MTDPYFYIQVILVLNVISLPIYLIFTEKPAVDKSVRTLLTMAFIGWQVYILLNKASV